jgi:hypothetical protein
MEVVRVRRYKNYEVRLEFDETAEFGSFEGAMRKNVYSLDGKFRGQWPLKKKSANRVSKRKTRLHDLQEAAKNF